ncbi:DUF2201 family putative metallopeptidase [Aidingimonas halophila]|uniref:Putative metallopeptidase domain-containing protein n=1 Tax=Aidingimonas halophila TaxID=574349 RepID=A0A1H3ERI1_9GAMM|nr:hypothetical protein [Aidingimonas halophila]GHC31598.1 hypothetical protein GCM10008094_25200 [Aidingimonas halophila]SDX81362.1 Putative metallopeptidase domain-containing protein [Aidingimonas halophila]
MSPNAIARLAAYCHIHDKPRVPTRAEQMVKKEQQQSWRSVRDALIKSHPFTGHLVRFLDPVPVIDSRLPTLLTDGRHLFINSHFAAHLPTRDSRFLLAHAAYHCIGGHFLPVGEKDIHRWNLACDHAVNYLAILERIDIPPEAVLYPSQAGCSPLAVYEWLARHPCPTHDRPLDIHQQDVVDTNRTATVIDPDFSPLPPSASRAHAWCEMALEHAEQRQRINSNVRNYLAVLAKK